jgi:ribonuclease P protein component
MGTQKRFGHPNEARLKLKREFDAVFREGGKGVNEALVVYAKSNGLKMNRLGLVVSKKNGKAVRRNRIRRLIREAFRLENPSLPSAYDIVCIPRAFGFPDGTTALRPLFKKSVLKAVKRFEERKGEPSRNRDRQDKN